MSRRDNDLKVKSKKKKVILFILIVCVFICGIIVIKYHSNKVTYDSFNPSANAASDSPVAINGGYLYYSRDEMDGDNAGIYKKNISTAKAKRIIKNTNSLCISVNNKYITYGGNGTNYCDLEGNSDSEVSGLPYSYATDRYVYVVGNGKIVRIDRKGNTDTLFDMKNTNEPYSYIDGMKLTVYKNKIYYIYCHIISDTDPITYKIYEMDMNGDNNKEVFEGKAYADISALQAYDGHLYFIENSGTEFSMIIRTDLNGKGARQIGKKRDYKNEYNMINISDAGIVYTADTDDLSGELHVMDLSGKSDKKITDIDSMPIDFGVIGNCIYLDNGNRYNIDSGNKDKYIK